MPGANASGMPASVRASGGSGASGVPACGNRWRPAAIVAVADETPRVRSLWLEVPGWPGHRAGQHVDVRLTAPDGYQAARSYSIASPPREGSRIQLTVERIAGGEVSPYLTQDARPGDRCEVLGPLGGYFVWGPPDGGPLFLAAGGAGIVPLMGILRHRGLAAPAVAWRLLYSCRDPREVIYRRELGDQPGVTLTLTRTCPPGWAGYRRRVDAAMLAEVAWPPAEQPLAYVCGPTGFVETVASALAELGHGPERILTERFGPSGS